MNSHVTQDTVPRTRRSLRIRRRHGQRTATAGTPGQTVALGVIGASVYYDETEGDSRLVTTIAETSRWHPDPACRSLKLGQGIRISVQAPAGKPVTAVRLTHTQAGLDIS